MTPTLSTLYVYPVKSGSPQTVLHAEVEARGLRHDRRWMVVDLDGKFITGRQAPRLVTLEARPTAAGLELAAPGQPTHFLAIPSPSPNPGPSQVERLDVSVWKSTVAAQPARAEDDAWISAFLDRPARWVYMDEGAHRSVPHERAKPDDEVSFADAVPLHLLTEESMRELDARLATPVSILRFRPNLVVRGVRLNEEDGWTRVRIGSVDFDVLGPRKRCSFVTVDPSGEVDQSGEPLRTLSDYRRTDSGVMFGISVIARGRGVVGVGDVVVPIA